jgi:type II secretory pathway component PulK
MGVAVVTALAVVAVVAVLVFALLVELGCRVFSSWLAALR